MFHGKQRLTYLHMVNGSQLFSSWFITLLICGWCILRMSTWGSWFHTVSDFYLPYSTLARNLSFSFIIIAKGFPVYSLTGLGLTHYISRQRKQRRYMAKILTVQEDLTWMGNAIRDRPHRCHSATESLRPSQWLGEGVCLCANYALGRTLGHL